MPDPDSSRPERDRRLAAKIHHGPRYAAPVANLVDQVLDRAAQQRMRRYGKAVAVLKQVLPAAWLARVRPLDLTAGELVLAVADPVLQAELAQHHVAKLQAALVAAGTGITRVRLRLDRRR